MKKLTIGIIAHVDSGKTTLSEALLYLSGTLRSFGRVDKGASFLDNNEMERERGITIFSKQARFEYGDTSFVLIDTPGHADFSAETERTLKVLDYAILLIGADDGIKGQTKILWKLLSEYQVPTFIFFNKMDRDVADKDSLMRAVKELAGDGAVDFTVLANAVDADKTPAHSGAASLSDINEQIAMCDEAAMEEFLAHDKVSEATIKNLIADRKLFPCLFGSALLQEGVAGLLTVLDAYTEEPVYPDNFSAQVYKVSREKDGVRLTFVKITGGSLKNKTLVPDGEKESKINQLRFYSGEKYELKEEAFAGDVCALTGLKESYAGEEFFIPENSLPDSNEKQDSKSSLKSESKIQIRENTTALLTPVLSYRVLTDKENDPVKILPIFKTLEEESPELSIYWDEEKRDIYVSVMGKVQLEILTTILKERFDLEVSFDSGNIVYKETITDSVIGVGHFEPLRHYAEVHLLLEPLERGSGLIFAAEVSSDKLAKNWQRLILTHLAERRHKGVLTGAPITDMKITLIAGKAHLKHTEGGDFRQATYRAVRQGLMMAENLLLEPFYRFSLEVPTANVGKALTDLDQMHAEFSAPELNPDNDFSIISGRGPVAALKDYPAEIASYTKGLGSISFLPDGYGECHNAEEVIAEKAYDPTADLRNTPDSVFCQNGAGHVVPYYEVYDYMHLSFDGTDNRADDIPLTTRESAADARSVSKTALGTDEVDAIINAISSSQSRSKRNGKKWKKSFGESSPSAESYQVGGRSVKISGLKKTASQNSSATQKTAMQKSAATKNLLSGAFPLEEADVLLVDGYNVIFAWEDLQSLARDNIDAARDSLIETLSKYSAMIDGEVVAVFDAYKVKGRPGTISDFQNIQLVYTAEEQTADQYIERFVNMANGGFKTTSDGNVTIPKALKEKLRKKDGRLKVAVVTSDSTEQVVTMGQGCKLISSREFKTRMDEQIRKLHDRYEIREQ